MDRKLVLDALLAEYKELKAEVASRVQRQSQVFNLSIVVLGVAVGGVMTLLSKQKMDPPGSGEGDSLGLAVSLVFALLPWISTPLALIFFDDELMIFATEIYLYKELKCRVDTLLEPEVQHLFQNSCRFLHGTMHWRIDHLRGKPLKIKFSEVSQRRWWLFRVPVFLAYAGISCIFYFSLQPTFWPLLFWGGGLMLLVANALIHRMLSRVIRDSLRVRKRYCTLA